MKPFISIIFSVLFLACSHQTPLKNPTLKVGNEFEFIADFLKDKEDRFDLSLSINNYGSKILVLKYQDFSCGKGQNIGTITTINKISGFMKKNEAIVTEKGNVKFILVCKIDTKSVGDYYLKINKANIGDKVKVDFLTWTLSPNIEKK